MLFKKSEAKALSSLCLTYFVLCRELKPRSHRKKINLLTQKGGILTQKGGILTQKGGILTHKAYISVLVVN
jgi:hypothetical protein